MTKYLFLQMECLQRALQYAHQTMEKINDAKILILTGTRKWEFLPALVSQITDFLHLTKPYAKIFIPWSFNDCNRQGIKRCFANYICARKSKKKKFHTNDSSATLVTVCLIWLCFINKFCVANQMDARVRFYKSLARCRVNVNKATFAGSNTELHRNHNAQLNDVSESWKMQVTTYFTCSSTSKVNCLREWSPNHSSPIISSWGKY